MLGDPQLTIIDVRTPKDWNDSKNMIKGALRQDPGKVPTWAQTLSKDKKLVVYCA
jgi:rhodanese-related sulfurtransferase